MRLSNFAPISVSPQALVVVHNYMFPDGGPNRRYTYRFVAVKGTAGSVPMLILTAWTSGPGKPADATQALDAGRKELEEALRRIHRAKLDPFNYTL